MNQKKRRKPPEKVRDKQYTVWVNQEEDSQFNSLLMSAGNPKPKDFIREMITNGFVQAVPQKSVIGNSEELLSILIKYRKHFTWISNLIRMKDPNLNKRIDDLVKSIQNVIDRI